MTVIIRLAVLIAICFLYAGCPAPKPPAVPPGEPPSICLGDHVQAYAGSCGNERTADGYLCAICSSERSCVDLATFTYCTGALACDDPRCKP